MNHTNEKILKRIQDLIEKGESVKTQQDVETLRDEHIYHVKHAPFEEWRTNALSFIESITEADSVYKRNFEGKVKTPEMDEVDSGIGILGALKNDLEQGHLTRFRTLVVAEVFSDFLEMAEYLLESDYKDPAASLTGAVLEDGLRKMCGKRNIPVKKVDDISSLNHKLADKKAFGRNAQKQVQAWKGIRDSADHARFDEYKKEDVEDMLKGVRRFLGENLK